MQVTVTAIRAAMKLGGGVAITLGTLQEPTGTRIAIVGSGLYLIHQHGYTVRMVLQFAAHNPAIVGYPSEVKFDLANTDKLTAMQSALGGLTAQLKREGDHVGADKIAALMHLPCEDLETIHDALVAGLSKAQFIAQLEDQSTEATPIRTENRPSTRDIPDAPAAVEPANTRVRIGNPASAHLYNVGVNLGGGISYIEVDANNRAQARKVAEDNGYEVRDINMIG